ncbi:MAG: TrkH family potassium uptake protein [Planctomycetes bacterium]|nr:TrkH family potassium uptake protein [Planctomycetota bacterium]
MDLLSITYTLAHLTGFMGAIMIAVGAFAGLLDGNTAATKGLLLAGAAAVLFMGLVRLLCAGHGKPALSRKDGMLTVVLAWIGLSALGALPYYVSGAIPSYLDAFFETVSGFTTCGATILTNVEALPRGLHLWRSTTHWLGGMGIVVLFVAVLPALGMGGYYLYSAEVAGPSKDRLKPTTRETAFLLWAVYTFFTGVGIIALRVAGMPWFDSVCHTFGGLATGGFSTKNASIGAYSPLVQTLIIVIMVVGGVNFGLWARMAMGIRRRNWSVVRDVLKDDELRTFLLLQATGALVVFMSLRLMQPGGFGHDLLRGAFNLVSISTNTGYATENFDLWPGFARVFLVVMMFIGGSAGSTCGGMKVVRVLLSWRILRRRVHTAIQTRTVESIHFNGRPVSENILHGVVSYVVAYVLTFVVGTLLLALAMDVWRYGGNSDFKFVTALSATATCLATTGPGLSGVIGNCAAIPAAGKVVLVSMMLLGRLEIIGLLAMFSAGTWRR